MGHHERVERSLAGVQNCEFLGDRDGTDGDHSECPVQKVESSEQRVEGQELGDRRALEVLSFHLFFFFLRENNNFVSIIFRRSRNLRRGNNFFVSFLQNERGQVQAHPSIDHRSEKSGDEASTLAEGQGDRGSRFR